MRAGCVANRVSAKRCSAALPHAELRSHRSQNIRCSTLCPVRVTHFGQSEACFELRRKSALSRVCALKAPSDCGAIADAVARSGSAPAIGGEQSCRNQMSRLVSSRRSGLYPGMQRRRRRESLRVSSPTRSIFPTVAKGRSISLARLSRNACWRKVTCGQSSVLTRIGKLACLSGPVRRGPNSSRGRLVCFRAGSRRFREIRAYAAAPIQRDLTARTCRILTSDAAMR